MATARSADSPRLDDLIAARRLDRVEQVLPGYLSSRRWFGGKARSLTALMLMDAIPMPGRATACLFEARYPDGAHDTYFMPLATMGGDEGARLARESPEAVLLSDADHVVYDPSADPDFCRSLLELVGTAQPLRGANGSVAGTHTTIFSRVWQGGSCPLPVRHAGDEQSNTSVLLGETFVIKLVRRPVTGPSPEIEVGRFLTDRAHFQHAAPLAGAIEYRPRRGGTMVLGVLHGFVPNHGTAWQQAVEAASAFVHQMVASKGQTPAVALALDDYLPWARLLGQRTAELHLALSSDEADPSFAPEPFTERRARAVSDRMQALARRAFDLLRAQRRAATEPDERIDLLLSHQADVDRAFAAVASLGGDGLCIRCHGDYHLGQVLWTGADYAIIDFEGEPARPAEGRADKDSPLRDAAGIVRSFSYAARTGLSSVGSEIRADLTAAAGAWANAATQSFLRGYREVNGTQHLLPRDESRLDALLRAYILEKAVYELGYELNNRPGWVSIPVDGLLAQLDVTGRSHGSPTA